MKTLWRFLKFWHYEGLDEALWDWAWNHVHDDEDHYIEWNEKHGTALLQLTIDMMLQDISQITGIIASRAAATDEEFPF